VNVAMSSTQKNHSLSDLLAGIAVVPADDDLIVTGVSIDSRKVSAGDLFIALPGSRQHGSLFIDDAITRGASSVVFDAAVELPHRQDSDVPMIKVPELSMQAGVIASRFFNEPSRGITVTGITGTNGKTTCSVLLAQAQNFLGARSSVIGTLGSGLWGRLAKSTHTTPDAVTLQSQISQFREQGSDELLMEVSSHGLQQGRVSGTDFNIAVFTNLSQDHLDYHGSMQKYGAAKAILFRQHELDLAVVNSDDAYGRELLTGAGGSDSSIRAKQIISYGIDSGDVRARHIKLHSTGISFQVQSRWGELNISSKLMGRFNVYNLLACAAVLLARGHEPVDVARALSIAEPAPGRMQCLRSTSATVVIDFAHTPDALQQALITLREHIPGRHLICVFGCGGDRDQDKRPIMGRIAEQLADIVIITDDNPRHEEAAKIRADILSGMQNPAQQIADRRQAIKAAWQLADREDIILIAGKGHESFQQVGDLKIPFSDVEVVSSLLSAPQEKLQ
jgi:UDP-N-acetylmuramoyl-L-alanyl-D-glutamate--2,6-diaminopimelate ligase